MWIIVGELIGIVVLVIGVQTLRHAAQRLDASGVNRYDHCALFRLRMFNSFGECVFDEIVRGEEAISPVPMLRIPHGTVPSSVYDQDPQKQLRSQWERWSPS